MRGSVIGVLYCSNERRRIPYPNAPVRAGVAPRVPAPPRICDPSTWLGFWISVGNGVLIGAPGPSGSNPSAIGVPPLVYRGWIGLDFGSLGTIGLFRSLAAWVACHQS